ncbi:MAG: serine/threonine protein kinase [Xanthomonadales bacterium]|jgi:serine/threonine-protein kinase|nr:serine/threonine protein kinase [Xanthomonadales bacterium]
MSRLAALFDSLAALPDAARAEALAQLDGPEPALAAALRDLFAAESSPERMPEPLETQHLLQYFPAHRDLGGFHLLRALGHGGMGEVWLAERLQSGVRQRAAIKLLRPDRRDPELARRFLDEQRIVAQLSHPHIVRLIDLGQLPDGTPWLAMDLIEGEPLLHYCDRRAWSLRQRVRLVTKVLGALQHAHQQLIVHRDLKSEHVLVDADGEPHLLDFGIARRLDATPPTGPAGGFFSACNVSPEQLKGERISVATDVYQLGLLLYRLVCGQDAQQREGAAPSTLQQLVLEHSPRPPSEMLDAPAASLRGERPEVLRRAMRGDLDRIILHALRAAPEERYPTASAFRDDLLAWLDCRPVLAVGQGRAYRARKFIQRHRVAVGISATAALLLFGAFTGLLYQELALARAHRQAVQAQAAAELQRARAEQVRDLLLDLFRAADPALDGTPGEVARIDDAVTALQRREAVGDAPELALALVEAAIGLGQHESATELLAALAAVAEREPLPLRRQRMLLLARLAVATQNQEELQTRLRAAAPLMRDAPETEQLQYLRLLSGVLLSTEPDRVLRLTDLQPLPPMLIRVRARALLKAGQHAAAVELLQAALQREEVGRLQRLGLQQALVSALVEADRGIEAERESQRMIDDARPLLGADSRAMFGYWNTRAIALAAAGRNEQAVATLDALLERPDLPSGVLRPLELNRLLYGSAVAEPDARTRLLLERFWPDRAIFGLTARRILLLAQIRLWVHAGLHTEAHRELAEAGELLEGAELESRLLRRWAQLMRRTPLEPSADGPIETLLRMDPLLAAQAAARQKK